MNRKRAVLYNALRFASSTVNFVALRPAEAVAVTLQVCDLPDEGWGSITLTRFHPSANKAWTDSGSVHDARGLKHGANKHTRTVPIPPVSAPPTRPRRRVRHRGRRPAVLLTQRGRGVVVLVPCGCGRRLDARG